MATTTFANTLKVFCDELRLTFPELQTPIDRALTITPAMYWKSWSANLSVLLECDFAALQVKNRGFILGAVRITDTLWRELSGQTQQAIWKYLRTLLLEASMELPNEAMTPEMAQGVLDILQQERAKSGDEPDEDEIREATQVLEESMKHMNPLMERMQGILGGIFGSVGSIGSDGSGAAAFAMPEIPDRLRNGKIAKLAEELSKQFNPADFGIDPTLLEGNSVEEVLQRLMDLYRNSPDLLINGAKQVTDRMKKQVLSGTLKQEELITEAKEYVALFKDHPQFKEAFSKFETLFGEDGVGSMFQQQSSGAPSERLRAAQERLRRKRDSRTAGKK
jgi:hypothetical protein